MEGVLWYLLASSRGGSTRARIVRALEERPRNANQLASELGMDYTTIRHHLDVLMENNVVRRPNDEYAAAYLFTERTEANWDTMTEVLETVEAGETGTDGTGAEQTETEDAKSDETEGEEE